jgi:hypothetical protein
MIPEEYLPYAPATEGDVRTHKDLAPGSKCPTCARRINHPKKESSPQSKTRAYRVPVDEHQAHKETLENAARFLGTYERPHWQFQTLTIALALVLQDEKLRGFAQRAA